MEVKLQWRGGLILKFHGIFFVLGSTGN